MPANANLTQLAFLLKTDYYKNLAYESIPLGLQGSCLLQVSAYEISTFHNREPPPKEILEDVTAKGGDILTRTLDNYPIPARGRETDNLQNAEDSDDNAADSQKTPAATDKMDADEPGSTGGRMTRGRYYPK